jgi:hypothetical protein
MGPTQTPIRWVLGGFFLHGVKRQGREAGHLPPTSAEVETTRILHTPSCAKFKAGRQPTAPLGELPETNAPFELVSIDIWGPYPETKKGHRYLLTFIDHFSRYPEAIPIPKQDAPNCRKSPCY